MTKIVEWASYGESIPLKCKKCEALFVTKNIIRIGQRGIFVYRLKEDFMNAMECNNLGHTIEDLEPCEEVYRKDVNNDKNL